MLLYLMKILDFIILSVCPKKTGRNDFIFNRQLEGGLIYYNVLMFWNLLDNLIRF